MSCFKNVPGQRAGSSISNSSIEEISQHAIRKTYYKVGEQKNTMKSTKFFVSHRNYEVVTMLSEVEDCHTLSIQERIWRNQDKSVIDKIVEDINDNDPTVITKVIFDLDIFECYSSEYYDRHLENFIKTLFENIYAKADFDKNKSVTMILASFPTGWQEDIHSRDKNCAKFLYRLREKCKLNMKQMKIEYLSHIKIASTISVIRRNNPNERSSTYKEYVNVIRSRKIGDVSVPMHFLYNMENSYKYWIQARQSIKAMETKLFLLAMTIILNDCDDIYIKYRQVQ